MRPIFTIKNFHFISIETDIFKFVPNIVRTNISKIQYGLQRHEA